MITSRVGLRFLRSFNIEFYRMNTVTVNKVAFMDLIRVKEEFDGIVESMELMADKPFMASHSKARKQIKDRDFSDWNAL